MEGPIKVGKNQITKDDEGNWIIEIFQFKNGSIPMYSVWDTLKDKDQAIAFAKILTPENEDGFHNKLYANTNYLKPKLDSTYLNSDGTITVIHKEKQVYDGKLEGLNKYELNEFIDMLEVILKKAKGLVETQK